MRNLRYLRLRAGLSQEQLAIEVGVSQAQVSYWENGLEIPTNHLHDLHRVLVSKGVIDDRFPPTALGGLLVRFRDAP